MDITSWITEDPLNIISSSLKDDLKSAVHQIYCYQIANAKETLDDLIQKLENELTVDNCSIDDLVLKLAHDLNGYVDFDSAIWLLERRLDRVTTPEAKFRALLSCSLLAEKSDIHAGVYNERLSEEAEIQNDQVEKLLANVMLTLAHYREKRIQSTTSCLSEISEVLQQEDFQTLIRDSEGLDRLYLIVALENAAFLFRKCGMKSNFKRYHKMALELCQKSKWDLGLKMVLQTNLIRAIKTSGSTDDLNLYINSLLEKIEEALKDVQGFEIRFGSKLLRDAYNDVSVAWSFSEIDEDRVLTLGEKLYASWKNFYGGEHHEVLFVASQLVYNYETLGSVEEADKYLVLVENSLKTFPESTKMIMQAKAKTLIHLWKVYRNRGRLNEAETWCREELRVNRKHGISQQYVANALRNLAFILKDLDRRGEGLVLLKECLEVSKEHSPDLKTFHEKVENEIKKF